MSLNPSNVSYVYMIISRYNEILIRFNEIQSRIIEILCRTYDLISRMYELFTEIYELQLCFCVIYSMALTMLAFRVDTFTMHHIGCSVEF